MIRLTCCRVPDRDVINARICKPGAVGPLAQLPSAKFALVSACTDNRSTSSPERMCVGCSAQDSCDALLSTQKSAIRATYTNSLPSVHSLGAKASPHGLQHFGNQCTNHNAQWRAQ
jgi:hypothetical protein